jgi:hypothetical protein
MSASETQCLPRTISQEFLFGRCCSCLLCATSEVLVSRSDDFPEYRVDSITVGAASFEDLPVSGTPRAASGVDGFLGLPLYRNVLVTIDYAAGRLPSKGSSTRDRPALLG